MPDQENTSVEPAGFFGRMLTGGNTMAITNPLTGSVSYNPEVMSRFSPDEIDNTFAHELTHSRQIQAQPFSSRLMGVARSFLPGGEQYNERPNEMEAFQAERDRSLSHHLGTPDPVSRATDIQLPNPSRRRRILGGY